MINCDLELQQNPVAAKLSWHFVGDESVLLGNLTESLEVKHVVCKCKNSSQPVSRPDFDRVQYDPDLCSFLVRDLCGELAGV